jgi:hypothetical protein
MTRKEAIAIIVSLASNWGENAEEAFTRRIVPEDDDTACVEIANKSGCEPDEVIQVRDLWRACKKLQTMQTEHVLTVHCQCPVDNVKDEYQTTILTDRLIKVEDILAIAAEFTEQTMFQEELTQLLAARLAATVTTVGLHSGVKTTCTSNPSADA